MAGIYIHIPFCAQACHYCNFYFSTSLGNKDRFIEALMREMELTADYLESEIPDTLYIGGGTPSKLAVSELQKIADKVWSVYHVNSLREFTIEANPDDLTVATVKEFKALRSLGFNRFSIGVQSFFDEDLHYMNRAHTASEADAAIKRVQDAGFDNITIDLIYGTPTMSDAKWLSNLEKAFTLQVPHISSYALTVEPKTALEHKIRKGNLKQVDENQSASQFTMLMNEMKRNGFEQYEISNFARDGKYAIHNSNYWSGAKYLGLGPSAHSYDGKSRRWNVANNIAYIEGVNNNDLNFETEMLTEYQRINERIMTGLRTKWGVNVRELGLGIETLVLSNLKNVKPEHYFWEEGVLRLTDPGKLFADAISSELFIDEEDL